MCGGLSIRESSRKELLCNRIKKEAVKEEGDPEG